MRYLVSICLASIVYLLLFGYSVAGESTIFGCYDKDSGSRRIVSDLRECGSYEMAVLMDKVSGETEPEDRVVKAYDSRGKFLGNYLISEFSLEELRLASSKALRAAP